MTTQYNPPRSLLLRALASAFFVLSTGFFLFVGYRLSVPPARLPSHHKSPSIRDDQHTNTRNPQNPPSIRDDQQTNVRNSQKNPSIRDPQHNASPKSPPAPPTLRPPAPPTRPLPTSPLLGHAPSTSPEKGIPVPKHLDQQKTLRFVRVGERKRLQSLRTVAEVEIPHHTLQQIGARAAGRVVRFFAEEGHHVRKGQALLVIDSPDVGKARSHFLRTHALWKLMQQEAERQAKLRGLGLNSASTLAQAQHQAARAKIEYEDARAQLRIFGVQPPPLNTNALHGRYTLRAVRQGAVIHVNVKLGQWVTPETALMHIEDRRLVWIHLRYPLQWAQIVKEGDLVNFTGDGLPHALSGKIVHISENVLRSQQNLQARVDLPNPNGLLRAGQLLEAHLAPTTATKEPPLVIPDEAIQTIGLSSIVFVLHKGHVHPRKIITGAAFKGHTEVLFGLLAGEKIVTRGAFLLKSILTQSTNDKTSHGH